MVALRTRRSAEELETSVKNSLTPWQLDLVQAVREFEDVHHRAPTESELAIGLSRSVSVIVSNLRSLERKGILKAIDEDENGASDYCRDAPFIKMVSEGLMEPWEGDKPRGSDNPIVPTPGPPLSDYIISERERLRGN